MLLFQAEILTSSLGREECMKRRENREREEPHLSVVKAVVHVPPIKSSQCPTLDSLQQNQTCSGLSEITVLVGCSQPSKIKPQMLVLITELAGFFQASVTALAQHK